MYSGEVLAESVLASVQLFERYLTGFDDSNRTRQAPMLPNHVSWTLGHCAMTMHRGAEKLDRRGLPESDFFTATLGAAWMGAEPPVRYETETVSFGSVPADEPNRYPSLGRGREIFAGAAERLGAALRAASPEKLAVPSAFFGNVTRPVWHVGPRAVFHNGVHCGQIADLRRVLGMKALFG